MEKKLKRGRTKGVGKASTGARFLGDEPSFRAVPSKPVDDAVLVSAVEGGLSSQRTSRPKSITS